MIWSNEKKTLYIYVINKYVNLCICVQTSLNAIKFVKYIYIYIYILHVDIQNVHNYEMYTLDLINLLLILQH